jgi:hypothetical protein
MKKKLGFIGFALVISCSAASAGEGFTEIFFGQYLQRTEGVTIGAGDAKQVNSAAEIPDPWPRNVQNRRIQANGARMTGAIQRYQDVKKLKEAPPPIPPLGLNYGVVFGAPAMAPGQ